MAYDEKLATRVRRLLSDRTDVTERAMFGGLTFMVSPVAATQITHAREGRPRCRK
jgi:hypothetical protein